MSVIKFYVDFIYSEKRKQVIKQKGCCSQHWYSRKQEIVIIVTLLLNAPKYAIDQRMSTVDDSQLRMLNVEFHD